ncbi:hypothetical protein N0X72_21755 [Streptomyces carpaticus]|uniref:PIN domain-containing protein n=1 Tax=Streptomyces cheonanensis TaxID=312720 RepID=A0ABP5GYR9_9ACTN|nr:hypothetical protein [Streptomyces sp. AA0539]UWM51417.1 hypothetical protein N0X72_21755 [Streptomyces carpaticus]
MSDGIIFDHSALLAVGRGHRQLSGFVVVALENPLFTLSVPALCMAEAVRLRADISTHLAHLPGVEVASLDRISADTMGRLAAALPAPGWPALHAVVASLTSGWEIATTEPGDYKGFGVPVLPVLPRPGD